MRNHTFFLSNSLIVIVLRVTSKSCKNYIKTPLDLPPHTSFLFSFLSLGQTVASMNGRFATEDRAGKGFCGSGANGMNRGRAPSAPTIYTSAPLRPRGDRRGASDRALILSLKKETGASYERATRMEENKK